MTQVVVVVVFFTLTDRASTIPSNTRGCQSGTWSAGQKKIRGTSTKLQWEQRKRQTHKRQRDRYRNNKIHRSEKDKRAAFDREFGIVPAASHPIPSPARNHAPKKRVASTTFRTLRVSVSLTAQSTSLRESLGWPNQVINVRFSLRQNRVQSLQYSLPGNLPMMSDIGFYPTESYFSSILRVYIVVVVVVVSHIQRIGCQPEKNI